jgi:5-methylcytosine-specific restriction endonuclease McrA
MTRAFGPRQRRILRLLAGNKCKICGRRLDDDFHADHVKAFSKGGKTTLNNGQALCPECNLKKGNKNASTSPMVGKGSR